MNSPEETNTGPVIRDLRRIDPATGQVRNPGQEPPAGAGGARPEAPQRGPGKSRPGKHAASKPGGTSGRPGPGEPPPAPGAGGGAGPADQAPGAAEPGQQAAVGESAPAAPAGAGPAESRPGAGPSPAQAGDGALAQQLAERTADLQRVTAEYANYRKRVERDRLAVREQALANVLSELLPVLDDIGRAREHGELVGGFKSVADSLESITTKLGLTSFGEPGEPFDPNVHEALMHSYSAEVTETTCAAILQPGYKVGDRILRPARVAVAEPGGDDAGEAAGPDSAATAESGQGQADGQEEPRE